MHMRALATCCLTVMLASCGSKWGKELVKDMPYGKATIHHSAAVDDATAAKVFAAMTEGAYNFASNLPEQIDRSNGRLVLRLGNDNENSIAAIVKDGEKDPGILYFEGLANHVSQAIGGESVDIVLCRKSLDEPFHTVAWKPSAK